MDERLRELARRFESTGAPEDEALWLRERARAGDLPATRLELAAHCEHPAALRALGRDALELPAAIESRSPERGVLLGRITTNEQWAVGLLRWGTEVVIRGFLSFARRVQGDWREGVGTGDLETTLRDVEDWLLCPCERHRQTAVERRITAGGRGWTHLGPRRAWRAGFLGEALALAVMGIPDAESGIWREAFRLATPLPGQAKWHETAEDVRAALAAELIPWSLAYGDPVAERVAKRR